MLKNICCSLWQEQGSAIPPMTHNTFLSMSFHVKRVNNIQIDWDNRNNYAMLHVPNELYKKKNC